jgi:hypothetical protein
MSDAPLPERPDLSWLRKRAKEALAALRRTTAGAKLADAQRAVARRHGFASWRALKAHVDGARAAAAAAPPLPEETVAAFLRAVGEGDAAAVTRALAATPGLVNAVGPHPFWGGRPQALHVSIDTDRFELTRLLLRAGADVNGDNAAYSHWSPLLLAVVKKRVRARRALVRAGARVGLVEALAMGDDARTLRLLRRGRAALPEHVPSNGSLLAFARTPAAIDRLVALGVSVDAPDTWGTVPALALSRVGRQGGVLVRRLAEHGAAVAPEVYARLGDRRSLAALAALTGDVLRRPSVLHAAVESRHRALVAWLLDHGADPDARSTWGSKGTCLHQAAWNGDAALVELLLARGADPCTRDEEHDNTPAGWAETAVTVTDNAACAPIAVRLRRAEAERG